MPGINDSFDEIHEGDRLSARWLNNLAGSVTRLSQMDRGRMRHLNNACGIFTVPEPDEGYLFYNGEGVTTLPAYGVAISNGVQAAGGPDFVPKVKQSIGYGCQKNFHVNGPNSVEAVAFGLGQFPINGSDLYIVAWDTTDGFTPAAGEMWGVQNGSYLIRKNYAGFRIEGVYDSTNHLALARSEPCYTILAKTTGSIAAHSSNQSNPLNIFVGDPTSEIQPAGNPQLLSVYNYTNCAINSGKFVICHYVLWSTAGWWYAQVADTA